ncbi:sensor histidine kinase [Chryseolinea lacunae]|uniref:histidine kinase n=1 Tax=Chryseolinea lacunae TaxID=2801331 RepID=A0ABS1L2J9_9BACT|nr:sensor histidine kinase [Chryseolinea lacunae]MBL0745737.1 sensor histidine kinase [Chryseolinea lacunae]
MKTRSLLIIVLAQIIFYACNTKNHGTISHPVELGMAEGELTISHVASLLEESAKYLSKEDQAIVYLDKALPLANKALEISKEIKYTAGINDASYHIAANYAERGNINVARSYLKSATDSLFRLRLISRIGKYHFEKGNKDSASLYMRQSSELKKIIDGSSATGVMKTEIVCREMLFLYYVEGLYDVCLSCAHATISLADAKTDTADLFLAHEVLGNIYHNLEEHEKSLENNLMAMKYSASAVSVYVVYYVLDNLRINFRNLNRGTEALPIIQKYTKMFPPENDANKFTMYRLLGDAYLLSGQLEQAESNYVQMMKVPINDENLVTASYSFGLLYYKKGDYKLAKQYVLQAIKPRGIFLSDRYLSNANKLLYKIDSAGGNYPSALEFYKKYKESDDAYFKKKQVDVVREMEVKYETSKKEGDIRLLRQQRELQDSRLQQSNFMRNVTIGSSVLLLIIAGLLSYMYKTKQESNKILGDLVTEKDWLLKEVHHRVKNNLHTIVSLLESQASYLKNTEALSAIQDSQNRVNAMSLIHQKLYQSENITTIYLRNYITELVEHLGQSFKTKRRILFEIDVDDVSLDVSQAIPLGLILNEAITNSMKYAFIGTRSANVISINLKEHEKTIKLYIADNGIGFSSSTLLGKEKKGLGLQLIEGLTMDLNGVARITSEPNVRIEIKFITNNKLEKR